MKLILIITLLIFSELGLMAQNDTLAINKVITQLFDGMRTSDSNLVKGTFHTEATLQTVFTNKTDETKLHEEQISEFIKAVGYATRWHLERKNYTNQHTN
jgi:hypothetical protein